MEKLKAAAGLLMAIAGVAAGVLALSLIVKVCF
jgi:hypothetical protein